MLFLYINYNKITNGMSKLNESIFDKIHNNIISKIKNAIKDSNIDTELIYQNPYKLVYKVKHLIDIKRFPGAKQVKGIENLSDLFETTQFYVVYDIYKSSDIIPIIVLVYANGNIKVLNNVETNIIDLDIFKPKSIEELSKMPADSLIRAYYNDKLDLNTLKFNAILNVVKKEPNLIKVINLELLSQKQIKKLYEKVPAISGYLSAEQRILVNKSIRTRNQIEYDENTDTYVFLAKEKFKEAENGMYIKDYYIESLNKIDMYNKNDLYIVNMLKLRERAQGDVKLYVLKVDKGLIENVLDNKLHKINEDEYQWLRKVIIEKSKPM